MNRSALAIVLIVAVAALGFFAYRSTRSSEVPVENRNFEWTFVKHEADEATGIPHTDVALRSGEKTYDAGTHEGECFVIEDSAWELLPQEQSGVICWFAGGGSEVGIFEEEDNLVVKRGLVDEGDAETPGTRGDFEKLFEL